METLTMPDATAGVQVQVQLEQQSPTLEHQQQAHLVQLSDAISDLAQDMQDDIVSIPKEVILITLVSQEQALYNPKHEHYRNTQRRDAKWVEIAENVGWSETQCKSKWKAMRDQYCRELKRSKFNAKTNVKWKYFKELEFLRPYALSRNYRPRHGTILTKNNSNNNQLNSTNNNNTNKFSSIKIESAQFGGCDFNSSNNTTTINGGAHIKNDSTTTRMLTTLTDEQLHTVMQQHDGNWNYLTTGTNSAAGTQNNNNALDSNSLLQQHQQQQSEDMLCALVESVAAATGVGQMQQLGQQSHNIEDDDDDPVHTFLNMESFFEKDLISMVQQDDILYNSFHPNYRNSKLKLEVWEDIARKLKKPVRRCRLKWKALRDQYIREHKRLKDRENAESLPRWKHYDALCFLQKFIKHKTSDFDAKNIIQIPKTEMDAEMDDNIMGSSPLRSPVEVTVVAHELQQHQPQQQQMTLQTLPSLTGPHLQQQQQQQQQQQHHHQLHHTQPSHTDNSICVVGGGGSVSGYDEMDIDHYIIGNASDEPHDDEIDEDEDHKSQQHFPDYSTVSNNDNNTTTNDVSHEHPDTEEEEEEDEFKDIKANSTTDTVMQQLAEQSATLSQTQQQQMVQQHQQEQQHMLTLSVSDTHPLATDESLLQPQDFNNDAQQQQQTHSLLNSVGNVCPATSSAGSLLNSNGAISMDSISLNVLTSSGATSTVPATTTVTPNVAVVASNGSNSITVAPSPTTAAAAGPIDDDEVGAFFKAVAMKIRNAKMSPVAFTDLQIDILRVINGKLRNH